MDVEVIDPMSILDNIIVLSRSMRDLNARLAVLDRQVQDRASKSIISSECQKSLNMLRLETAFLMGYMAGKVADKAVVLNNSDTKKTLETIKEDEEIHVDISDDEEEDEEDEDEDEEEEDGEDEEEDEDEDEDEDDEEEDDEEEDGEDEEDANSPSVITWWRTILSRLEFDEDASFELSARVAPMFLSDSEGSDSDEESGEESGEDEESDEGEET